MDPSVLGALIGGGVGIIVSWGAVLIFFLSRGERYGRKERKVNGRVISDKQYSPMFGRPVSDWRRVFTCWPVHTLDEGWVFCRFVWRRRIYKHQSLPGGGSDFWFQYLVKLQYVYD
ncbi:membrane protein [Arthrobacter phage Tokki]|nr:membrane protein [Arthrobacter phage Tokki]